VDYEFRAVNGDDWYEAVVAILKVESDGSTTVYASKCYRGDAIADFQSGSIGVSDDGNYILAFYPASYDRTGGSALGASLFVDGFGLGASPAEPSVAPIIAPTYPVAWCHPYCLELGTDGPDSSSFIPVNAAIESEYNAAAAMCSPFVDFSLDTNSCNGDVCLGSMETHSSCSSLSAGFSYSYTPTADGFIATFSASVDGATSGCCSCNSCASGAVYTNEFAFSTLTHTSVDYEFRAVNGDDWYEAVVAILKVESDGSTTVYASKCYRGDAIADFQSGSIGVSDDGNYILAFYPASYDRTGGSALGASLFVDGFGLGGP